MLHNLFWPRSWFLRRTLKALRASHHLQRWWLSSYNNGVLISFGSDNERDQEKNCNIFFLNYCLHQLDFRDPFWTPEVCRHILIFVLILLWLIEIGWKNCTWNISCKIPHWINFKSYKKEKKQQPSLKKSGHKLQWLNKVTQQANCLHKRKKEIDREKVVVGVRLYNVGRHFVVIGP